MARPYTGEFASSGEPAEINVGPHAPGLARVGIPALLAAALVAGCGSSGSSGSSSDQASSSTEPTVSYVGITMKTPNDGDIVRSDSVPVVGKVFPADSKLDVDGKPVDVKAGQFSTVVAISGGGLHTVTLRGTHPGRQPQNTNITVNRKLSAAEQAQLAAQQETDFKAAATQVDTQELQKDPTRFAGDKVVITGPILQIEERSGRGFMLVQTNCDQYNICSDEVFVSYKGHVAQDQDQTVTVYDTVTGVKHYQTQIGGSNTVAAIDGKYIGP